MMERSPSGVVLEQSNYFCFVKKDIGEGLSIADCGFWISDLKAQDAWRAAQ
jgi:hypothetical protein